MASIKYTNNAKTTLAADLNNSATSATVVNGNLFPSLSAGEHFYCTFDDGTNTEIVKVTARSTHVLTIVRAQDNTSARAFSSGDKAELRITAVVLEEVSTSTSSWNTDIFAGDGSDTTFTLTQAATDEKYLQVYIDGAFQAHNTYSVSGTTLTFATAPANSRVITVYHIEPVALGTADTITATANNSANETVFPVFVDGATGTQGLETDTGFTYNPSSGVLTIAGELDAGSLDISGNADIDGTLEADAITVNGVTLAETISDTVGAMVSSNTETGIAVTYDDSDNTLDFTIGTLNQDTTGLAGTATALATARTIGGTSFDGSANIAVGLAATATALATARTIHGVSFDGTANIDLSEVISDTVGAMVSSNTESNITVAYQDADNTLDFTVGTLNQNTTGSAATLTTARTIGGVSFNGSANIDLPGVNSAGNQNTTGTAATVTTAAQSNITSLGTLTTLTVDNVIINGTTIGHTDDTDLMTLADGVLTVAGEVDAVSLDISGDVDVDGTLETDNLTIGGAQGSDGQVLTSTGSGVAWEAAGGGAVSAVANGADNRISTFSSGDALNGEANLTFDGNTLQTVGSANVTRVGPIGQASGAVQTWNVSTAANTFFVPNNNNTVINPGGTAVTGAIIQVEIAMGGTVYAIAWQNKFKFGGDGSTPTVTATANKTDIFTFRYNGTVWQEIGRSQNLAQTV